jgi:hypothetical protein
MPLTFDGSLNTVAGLSSLTVNGFFLTPNTITSSVTVPAGYNGSLNGPITIANNVVLTIATGARLVIL